MMQWLRNIFRGKNATVHIAPIHVYIHTEREQVLSEHKETRLNAHSETITTSDDEALHNIEEKVKSISIPEISLGQEKENE